jgi:MOSC domain-containing protein YiiM
VGGFSEIQVVSFPIAKPFLLHCDRLGRVEGLLVRPKRNGAVQSVSSWDPTTGVDHNKPEGGRAITLIQSEHLDVIASLSGQPVSWEQTRRNVLVSGINLLSLVGHRFRVGEAILEGTCLVDPCKNMEAAMGPGSYAAMVGHGGIGARILQAAELRVGDTVQWLGPEPAQDG